MSESARPNPSLPNLVFFVPDQWRGDVLGHMGNPAARTPNLDKLVASEAVSFRNAFCQNPVCTPSRCSFLTGWYPHVGGHRTMYHMLHPDRGEPCLLKVLHDSGYEVWWGGKNDFIPRSVDPVAAGICDVRYRPFDDERVALPGFQANLHADTTWRAAEDEPDYYSMLAGKLGDETPGEFLDPDWLIIKSAIEFVKNREQSRPFCLFLAIEYPHPPYGVEEPYYSAIDRSKLPPRIPPCEEGKPPFYHELRKRQNLQDWPEHKWEELRATYYGMCMRVDAQLGLLTDALRDVGSYDETALFFFSDHGDYTGDHGIVEKAQNLFPDCLTRVPFIFKPPATHAIKAGISDAMVELVDFPATVYDLTGIEPGYDHFGKSLLPLLEGGSSHRDAVFCEGGRRPEELHCKEGSRADPESLYWPRLSLQHSDEPFYHGKAIMCRTLTHKLIYRQNEENELYDLTLDPEERVNRFGDPAYREETARLEARILRWLVETADVVPLTPDTR